MEKELERRKMLGPSLADPVPHPNHILMNVAESSIQVLGPMKEEDCFFDMYEERAQKEGRDLLALLKERLRGDR